LLHAVDYLLPRAFWQFMSHTVNYKQIRPRYALMRIKTIRQLNERILSAVDDQRLYIELAQAWSSISMSYYRGHLP
jgi:hypothetical protein